MFCKFVCLLIKRRVPLLSTSHPLTVHLHPSTVRLGAQVDYEVREARRDEIISIQQGISERFAKRQVGAEVDVIVDRMEMDEEGQSVMIGRTRDSAPDVDPIVFISDPEDPQVSGTANVTLSL
eukprot:4890858-Pyramimonas_sp.AAC.1